MAWCTIESDPGVFTELIEAFGAKGVKVEELWALDDDVFEPLRPIYGLFFLFKWEAGKGKAPARSGGSGGSGSGAGGAGGDACDDVFFCQQTITNACGTIALLHVLLNHPDIDIGDTLRDYKSFACALPPDMRGQALGGYDPIRIAHNSFARPEPFEMEERVATKSDDVYHFIAYTAVGGVVYEIDGLKPGPVAVGAVADGGDWLHVATPEIQRRIEEYSSSEIRFNLLALVRDRTPDYLADAAAAAAKLRLVADALAAADAPAAAALPSVDGLLAAGGLDAATLPPPPPPAMAAFAPDTSVPALRAQFADLRGALDAAAAALAAERDKRATWHAENERRRHNFVPFIMELLSQLASAGTLGELYEAGKKKAEDARTKARARRAAAGAAAGAGAGGGDDDGDDD